MDLAEALKRLRDEDVDVVCDPFAKALFADRLLKEDEIRHPVEELVGAIRDLRGYDAIYTIAAKGQTDWNCALGLWIHALAGDDEALFESVRLFKQLAGALWVQRRLRQACLARDWGFVNSFGEAVSWQPERHKHEDYVLNVYLAVFWKRDADPLCEMSAQSILYELKRQRFWKKGEPTEKERRALNKRLSRLRLKRARR